MERPPGARLVRGGSRWLPVALAALALSAGGCTTLREWVRNGFKVGPNYREPPAAVPAAWIDAADPRVAPETPAGGAWWGTFRDDWWGVFRDPVLDALVDTAYRQNLDLKTAAARVFQAQAKRNVSAGNLFPQSQNAVGDYAHAQLGKNLGVFNSPLAAFPSTLNVWATGFNASWELDFWGRLRRTVESADAQVGASVEGYRDALVTLLAEVATSYVQVRTFQQRIAFARRNVEIQRVSLRLAEARLKAGKATALDVKQARSSLAQTEASIPPLEIGLRQANDRLCVLVGVPAQDLLPRLADGPIPAAPAEVAAGVPADLLRRRPDVRRALRDAAAQAAQIGIAEADFYPQVGVTGFIGYAADDIRQLFAEKSFTGLILPNFQWKILNYGRVLNNVRAQDAGFQERVLRYQQTVLTAGRETEDALAAFLQYQVQAERLKESVKDAEDAVELVQAQYEGGVVDFNRVLTAQAQLVGQQDQLAAARGNIAVSLIAVYRALGGGWQSYEKAPVRAGCEAPGRPTP